MTGTRKVLYIYALDAIIYRSGSKTSPNIDKVRYKEREPPPETLDIATYEADGVIKVKAHSGGVSFFDGIDHDRKMRENDRWYFLPMGTEIPAGLVIGKDERPNRKGLTHYGIEADVDMPLEEFFDKLRKLAEFAKRIEPGPAAQTRAAGGKA